MNGKLSLKFISIIKSISWAKLIPPLIIIIFVLLSFVGMKNKIEHVNQIQRGVVLSQYEQEQYNCFQSAIWFPIGAVIGFLFIISPSSLDRVLYFRYRKTRLLLFINRVFGGALLMLAVFDLWNNCNYFLSITR